MHHKTAPVRDRLASLYGADAKKSTRRGANPRKEAENPAFFRLKKRVCSGRMFKTRLFGANCLRTRGADTPCKPQAHIKAAARAARSGRCLPRAKRLLPSPICPLCECECTRSKRKRRRLPSIRRGMIGCSRGRAGHDCARLPGERSRLQRAKTQF